MARIGRRIPARIRPERRFRGRCLRRRTRRGQQIHRRRTCGGHGLLFPRDGPLGQNGRLVVGILRRRNGPDAHRAEDTQRQSLFGDGLHHLAVVRDLHRDDDLGRVRNRAGSHFRSARHPDRRRRNAALPRLGGRGRGAADGLQRGHTHRHGIHAGTLRRQKDARRVHAPHRSGTRSGALRLGAARLHDRPRKRLGRNPLGTLLRLARGTLRNRTHAQRRRSARTTGSRHPGRHRRRFGDRDGTRTRRGIHRRTEIQRRQDDRLVGIHDAGGPRAGCDRRTPGRRPGGDHQCARPSIRDRSIS